MKEKILNELKEALEFSEPNGYTKIDTNIIRRTIEFLEEKEKTRKLVCKDGEIYDFKEI